MQFTGKLLGVGVGSLVALCVVGTSPAIASETRTVKTVNRSVALAATHVVQSGETLSTIGGPNWYELYQLNRAVIGPDPNDIYPGMVLQLPWNPDRALGFSASEDEVIVMPGQSLSEIGSSTGCTWHQLYEINKAIIGADPSNIHPGMVLQLC